MKKYITIEGGTDSNTEMIRNKVTEKLCQMGYDVELCYEFTKYHQDVEWHQLFFLYSANGRVNEYVTTSKKVVAEGIDKLCRKIKREDKIEVSLSGGCARTVTGIVAIMRFCSPAMKVDFMAAVSRELRDKKLDYLLDT